MSILKDFSYRNTFLNQNTLLTYHEKLKNEIENIPKLHKKFFMKSLAKYKFDLDVYIPQSNEKNRKIYPDKDYLLNKIILYDNNVNKYKQRIDTISKDFSKFYKSYNFLKNNNSRQKDYMSNLLSLYKEKNNNNEDLEYKTNENIFTESVLLESHYDEQNGNYNEFFRKYGETDGKKLLKKDEKILITLDKVIHHKSSPNSMNNKSIKNVENFITSINQSYYINKNDKTEKTEISGENIDNKEEQKEKNELIKKDSAKSSNKKIKNNNYDKYLLNSKLMKLKKINKNKYKNDLIMNESSKKNLKYHNSNIELINENEINQKNVISKIARLKKLFLNKYSKEDLVNNKNIDMPKIKENNDDNNNDNNDYDNTNNNDNANSKYLLTTLNKVKINGRNKINDLSEIKNEKILLNTETENDNSKNKIYESFQKGNLKINLPGINKKKEILNKSINYTKIKEDNSQNKSKIKQKNKLSKKKENSNSKKNIKRTREKDINRLYTTISTNSNFFREYPSLKVKNYFKKYKNLNIRKIEPEKGSNLFPILDRLENIVKNQDISKLAKSLDETKTYLILKKSKHNKRNSNEEKFKFYFDKVNDNEKKFPLIKYDCAEKIIFGKENI